MLEAIGDLWTYPAEYRCVTTNGVIASGKLVMGAGVALQAKQRFPHLPAQLAAWLTRYGNRPFLCRSEGIITFPTKQHWRDKSLLPLIEQSAKYLRTMVDQHNITSVALTRPGCGNGGLLWHDVKPFLTTHFDDRFTVLVPSGTAE